MFRVAMFAMAFAMAATFDAAAEPAVRNSGEAAVPQTQQQDFGDFLKALHWTNWPRLYEMIPPPPGRDKPPGLDLFENFKLPDWLRLENFPPPFGAPNSRTETGANDEKKRPRFLYFSGTDLWAHWMFAHAGILWSPQGLDNDGFTLKLLTSAGVYRYLSTKLNNSTVLGQQFELAVMPGLRFVRAGFEFKVFAGPDYQLFHTYPLDPGAHLIGSHFGARVTAELWNEPSTTTMLAVDGSFSTLDSGNYARAAFGWRAFDLCYIGPELQVYTSENYRHMRYGVHFTAYKRDDREWLIALGIAEDSDKRSGAYLRLGFLRRR